MAQTIPHSTVRQTTGQVEQLEPLVRRVLAPNPSAFTFTGTQTYLAGTQEELIVIDPGPDDPAHVAAIVNAIGSARVLGIACTHTHFDHSPAAAALKAVTGAPIVGCAPLLVESEESSVEGPFDLAYSPDHVLDDGAAIVGRDWRLTAVATPGHTSNHLCYHLDPSGALFTGDHVMQWSTTVIAPTDGNMGDYMASMERLAERSDRIYFPAHGPAVENPQELVKQLILHRRQREEQIVGQLGDRPLSVPAMVTNIYIGLAPALTHAAGLSLLAHLLDLEQRGIAERVDDGWRLSLRKD